MPDIPSRILSLFDDSRRLERFELGVNSLEQVPWSKSLAELRVFEYGGAPHLLRFYEIGKTFKHRALMCLQWDNELTIALLLAHHQHPSQPGLVDVYFYENDGVGFVLLRENGAQLDINVQPRTLATIGFLSARCSRITLT